VADLVTALQLEDGWTENQKTGAIRASGLIPGDLSNRMREELGNRLRWNELFMRPELDGKVITASSLELLYIALSEKGWRISQAAAADAVIRIAHENSYNPVVEYLELLEKDPSVAPIELSQIGDYWGVGNDHLDSEMLQVMLIGAVGRALKPGLKFDTMLVFKGAQGKGKSRSLRSLFGPDWLIDTQQPKHLDQLMVLHGCWAYEAAELDYLVSRSDQGQLKGLVSSSIDTFKAPYGRYVEAHPRRSIMVGTCNRDDFLRDPTGHRRFLVVEVDQIDVEAIERDRDQIWKAAVLAFRSGANPYLSHASQAASNERNKAFELENPLEAPVARWLRDAAPLEFTLDEAIEGVALGKLTGTQEHQLKDALKEHGCKPPKGQTRRHGMRLRLWQHYKSVSADSLPPAGGETPQKPAVARDLGDLSHVSLPNTKRVVKEEVEGERCQNAPQEELPISAETPRHLPKALPVQSIEVSQPLSAEDDDARQLRDFDSVLRSRDEAANHWSIPVVHGP